MVNADVGVVQFCEWPGELVGHMSSTMSDSWEAVRTPSYFSQHGNKIRDRVS